MKTITAVDAFLNSRRAENVSPATIGWYTQQLHRFERECPELPRNPQPIESYIARPARAGLATCTIHNCFTGLRAFFRWTTIRYSVPNPMIYLRAPRVPKKLRPTLEPDEVGQMIQLADSPRDRAVMVLLADSGVRAGELCSIRRRDIRGDTVQVAGKSGQREVPISEITRRLLVDLAGDIGPDGLIFRGRKGPLHRSAVYDIVRIYMKRAGVSGPKLGPHRLRHAFGKAYLVAGGDLRSLQQIMGHASITTTEQYTALTRADIVAKHHQFTLLRSAQGAAQGSFIDRAGVLKEAEDILNNNDGR